jgi:putative membrane protein
MKMPKYILILLLFMTLSILVSLPGAKDTMTWFFETVPVMIGIVIILCTYKKFTLTPLLAVLIAIHSAILCLGAHYTYAEVPMGFWIQDLFAWERNPYDRIGHLAQGFIPAILAREVLIRNRVIASKAWMFYIICAICLSFSAFYEIIEWWSAVLLGDSSQDFLGTQGDIWDAQWDMLLALIGCIVSLLTLSRWHDKQLT